MFQEALEQGKLSAGIVITFQVMTFSGVSARNPYPVGPMTKRIQDKLRTHPARTRDTDNPNIGWVRHSAHASEVGSTVTAPVTEKGDNFWFLVVHGLLIVCWFTSLAASPLFFPFHRRDTEGT
jgi:hypothetical protein